MYPNTRLQCSSAGSLLIGLTLFSASTDPVPAQNLSTTNKPAWLTDLSLSVKESYDDNVFLSGVDPKYLPASYNVPAGSVAALENRGSWVTTFSPKLGFDLAPLLGDRQTLKVLSLVYSPDFVIYHDDPTESYDAHRFATSVKAGLGDFSASVDNGFTYIHGSEIGVYYPGALFSAIGIGAPRERREQIQDRATVNFQYDQDKWFVRPTASLIDYDLMTELLNVTGYQNYSSRYDLNGGADFGYKILPQFAATVGYRYGHQYQEQFNFLQYSSPSDYQRVLLGLEGKPWNWLDLKLQGGPDFRSYADDSATHITPIGNKHAIVYYGEELLTATLTDKDTLAFKGKQWQWVSSIGRVPYFECCYDLSYRRKLTSKLSLDLGAKLLSCDYTSGNLASCQRDDWQYTFSGGLGYCFNSHVSASLTYARDMGRNAEDGVVNPQTREYDRDLISLGATVKF